MATKKEPTISEQQAQEIVERMSRREYRSEKSMDNFYKNIGLNPEELEQPGKCVTEKTETAMADEPSNEATEKAAVPQKRISSKLGIGIIRSCLQDVPIIQSSEKEKSQIITFKRRFRLFSLYAGCTPIF
mgnify:CR=1 FL=1